MLILTKWDLYGNSGATKNTKIWLQADRGGRDSGGVDCLRIAGSLSGKITYGIVQCGPHIENGVPYVRVSDMNEPELDVDQMLRTSKTIAAKFPRSTVHEGDIVYALRGKLGEVRQVGRAVAGANLTQGTAKLSPKEQLARSYLYWAMRNPRSLIQAEMKAKGSTFREITLADLRRIKILIPTIPEQRAIVGALGDVDALIGALDQLIAKKCNLKQAAMQQLLTGKQRLPGFSGEWKVKPFDDLLKKLNSKLHQIQTSEYSPHGNFPVIDQGQSAIVAYSDQWSKAFHCPQGGVIIFGDHTRIVKFVDYDFLVGADGKQVLTVKEGNLTKFFFYQLSVQEIPNTGYNRHFKFLKEMSLPAPLFAEQAAITEMLSDIDAEITALEQRRDKTRVIKQGMMQELLTGKTRLI